MEFAVAKPGPALAHIFSLYYYIKFDYPLIEDKERADVGYLRFLFQGSGTYEFADGGRSSAYDVMLVGPSTVHAHYFMNGPLESFGAVILPQFWGALGLGDASDYANASTNIADAAGHDFGPLRRELSECHSIEEMGKKADAYFAPRLQPVDPDHLDVLEAIGAWLRHDPIPSPEALYATTGLGARQVMRIANRYFGAPPSLLARKFRALRTASLLVGGQRNVSDDMISRYADRAHLSREVKHFTGLSPRELIVNKSPIMQITLAPELFNYESPWM